MEGIARVQGYYDFRRNRDHHIWQMVDTTKDLEAGQHKVRRICNAQSVIVFRVILEGAEGNDVNREREDREATEVARKLLPTLKAKIRKEDKLSVNGPGIMTAVIRAEQSGAEIVSERIKRLVEGATVHVGLRNRQVKATVAYSSLTFASKAPNGQMTVSGPLYDEALAQAFAEESGS
jgi:hypothetical protein